VHPQGANCCVCAAPGAGLQELEAAQGMQRAPFETMQEFTARELQVRSDAHSVQVAHEVQASR